ncbi:unnamed protein product [Penicillium roqueforti FM164]|uniref:Genomic scaffold, ProqFM164S04 n=1 Tax=Penicillium roqueforti (strain FM164) TaxID=1365484 RepID=W6QFC9_PENRF|nr:unnamed protein product [Penicillium roqueforti FM164]
MRGRIKRIAPRDLAGRSGRLWLWNGYGHFSSVKTSGLYGVKLACNIKYQHHDLSGLEDRDMTYGQIHN